jgi:hypothetical protein
MTVYMIAAALVEERDLVAHFGRAYREYQEEVPMFVPCLKRPIAAGKPASHEVEFGPNRAVRSEVQHAYHEN